MVHAALPVDSSSSISSPLPANYIEGFLCMSKESHADWTHVVEISKNSPVFGQIAHTLLRLLNEKESRISREILELCLARLVSEGVSLEKEEKTKEVCEALLKQVVRFSGNAKIGAILDWLEGVSSDPETFFELLFGIVEAMDESKRGEFLDALVLRFHDLMKPLEELRHSNPTEIVHRSFHDFPDSPVSLFLERCALLLFPSNRIPFIQSFIPSIFEIPAEVESLPNWCKTHPFFNEIESIGSRLLFRESH